MPVLGCGAEMAKLMDVSDQDVAVIEDVIAERLELGVSQAVAQRQAVDEALAQLADERAMVMAAVDEQLGVPLKESAPILSEERAPEPVAADEPAVESTIEETAPEVEQPEAAPVQFANKAQTETPEFKKWFGDSAVVDADGKPLVVYHYTENDFNIFDTTRRAIGGEGSYFSSYKPSADGGRVIEAYLSLKNPKVITHRQSDDVLKAQFIEQGHDGVIILDANGKIKTAVAFYPTQIKSATGNNGDFDAENPDIRFANKATPSKWKDETGRIQLAPGAMLVEAIGKAAGPLLDRIYLRQAKPEVRHALRKMKVDIQKAMDTTSEITSQVNALSADERNMISDIIEKELKAGVTPPESAVRNAALMNEAFGTQTDELVRLGMLSQEAADKWRGKYLPRYYESKLAGAVKDAWSELANIVKRQPNPLGGIKGKHLKGRGLTMTISTDDLDSFKAKGWEVRSKKFDPKLYDTVQVWRDFTREERDKMGEIRDAGFRFVMGYMQTQKDIALGRMYENISKNPDMASLGEQEGFVQVPDTTVPDTGAKRYGMLAGMFVDRNVMAQLALQVEMESEALKLYRKALSAWKENKTVLNPVSHMNNFVSNMTMAHLAGVSYVEGHKYAGAIKDLASTAPMVKEARDNGLFIGSMSDEELNKMLPLDLQTMINKQDGKTIAGLKLAHNVLAWGLRRPAGIAYEFGDRFFKYLIYKDARGRGLEPEAAVDYAQKFIFTYDDLPRGARAIRDLAIPFFSYSYKAIPLLGEIALTHPHRMIAPAALLSVASMAAYAIAAGGDDDDKWELIKKYVKDADYREKADALRDEEYKLLPEWMKGRTSLGSPKAIRLGEDQLTGNPVFLDTSRFIPGGDLFDVTGNAGGIPWLQPLTPSNPLLSTYAAMFGNKDLFTGKELVNKDIDTNMEAARKRADWLWKMATPAIAINQGHWDRLINAAAYETGAEVPLLPDFMGGALTGTGRDGQPVQGKYAAMNTIGIKARPLDLEMSEQIQKSTQAKTLRDLDARLAQAKRLNAKGAMPDRELDRIREEVMDKKDLLRDGKTVDGKDKP